MAQFSHVDSLKEDYDPNKDEMIENWRSAVDALGVGRITWEKFLQKVPLSSPLASFLTTSETGQSLLHLAVLSNRIDLVQELLENHPQLKWRRNSFNWTPLELARFLPRQHLFSFLHGGAPLPNFLDQPNVTFPDRALFESFPKIEYLLQPLFESVSIFDEVISRTKKAKREDAIPLEKIWMGIYFDKEIQTGTHPKVSIRFINESVGFGVFAEQRIPSCAFAGEYLGVVQERKKKKLKDKIHTVGYTVWEKAKKYIIDAERMGNFTRFINHSAKPNLSLQSVYWRDIPRMIFVALKEIPEGTQLTFDYGAMYWKECRQTPILFD